MGEIRASITSYRAATWGAVAIAGLTTLAALGVPLLLGRCYYGLDLTQLDLGNLCAVRRALDGDQPLWLSRLLGNGAPLLLRPSAQLFYPPRWPLLLLSADLAASLGQVLHLAAGAAATAWLARTFRVRPLGAACAGLCFAFSGTAIDLVVHTGSFALAAAYLPLLWSAVRRGLGARGGVGHLLTAGLALCALLLGGEPQAYGLAVGLLLLEVGGRCVGARRWPGRRAGALLGLVPASLAVGALLWVGFWEEAVLTARVGGLALEQTFAWSFSPSLWLEALWPSPIPRELLPAANISLWSALLSPSDAGDAWNPRPYVGPLFVSALVVGLLTRRARIASLAFAVGLLLSLGDTLPLLPALARIAPALRIFRYPEKFLVVTTLAAVVVVAVCLQRVAFEPAVRRRWLLASALLLMFQLAALAGLAAIGTSLDQAWSMVEPQTLVRGLPSFSTSLRHALLHATTPLALALLGCWLWPRSRPWIAALVVVDLTLAAPAALSTGPALSDLDSPSQVLETVSSSQPPVVCVDLNAAQMSFQGFGEAPGWGQLALRRIYWVHEQHACAGVINPVPYVPQWTTMNQALTAAMQQRSSAAARALGCTHLVSDLAPTDGGGTRVSLQGYPGPARDFLERGPRIFTIHSPLPAVFLARDPSLVEDWRDAVARLLASVDADAALRVVEDPLGRLDAGRVLPDGRAAGALTFSWPRPDQATIEVEGSGGAVIGLRSAFLVGWGATQAGRQLPVLRISGQHIATVVDDVAAGPVQLSYRSPSFAVSVVLSSLGFFAIIGIAWYGGRSRLRRAGAQP